MHISSKHLQKYAYIITVIISHQKNRKTLEQVISAKQRQNDVIIYAVCTSIA